MSDITRSIRAFFLKWPSIRLKLKIHAIQYYTFEGGLFEYCISKFNKCIQTRTFEGSVILIFEYFG